MTATPAVQRGGSHRVVVRWDRLPAAMRVEDFRVDPLTRRRPAAAGRRCAAAILLGVLPRTGLVGRLLRTGCSVGAAYRCRQPREDNSAWCHRHREPGETATQGRRGALPYAASRARWEYDIRALYGSVPTPAELRAAYYELLEACAP